MTKDTSKPYDWIKKVPASIFEMDAVPLLGHPPPFPWEELTGKLTQNLDLQDIKIQPSDFQWREAEELFSGLGDPLIPLNFSISPFEGKLFWTMSQENIKELMTLLLLKDGGSKNVLEEEYQTGFYHFLALECVHTLETLGYDPDITIQLIKNAELPNSSMLTLDVGIAVKNKTLNGRLFLSPELRQSMAKFYAKKAQEAPYKSPLAEKLEVTLHLEAGSTTLSRKEWSKVKPGDFLILDNCTLKPGEATGKVMITLNGHPFFRGKVKEGNVKILDHPQYREEQ